MTTSMKTIIAAIGIAVLASPVMAQSEQRPHPLTTSVARAHGSVARIPAHRLVSREPVQERQTNPEGCNNYSIYEQCGFAH
jgi:hypothetical protein